MGNDSALKSKIVNYNLRINIANGIASIIALNLVTPYFAKFAERLGASDYHIALLSSLPATVSIFVLIPGAIIIDSFKNKKTITGSIMFSHKVFFLLLALVPFVEKHHQPWVFVILVGLMNLPGSISTMGYQSCIGDIFDERTRGQAMGLRNRYSAIFGMGITFLSGQLLTRIPQNNEQAIVLYQFFFVIAFIIAQGEVFSFFKLRGIKHTKNNTNKSYVVSLKETIKSLPSQNNFLIFAICSLIFHFGWQMGWPLFNIYSIKYLNANELWLSAISIASSLSSIIAYTIWAKFADKKGNSFALSVATLGMAITPLFYVISKNLISLVFFNIIVGISTAGTTLILFNILLDVTPDKNRTVYIAIYNTLINISASISPIIGVAIKDKHGIVIALVIVSILRFIGSFTFFIRNRFLCHISLLESSKGDL